VWTVSLRENQFVLFQIDDHHFKFVQKIHTQQSVYVLSKTFGNFLHVHGEDSMIPPKYGPKFQRGLCEDTSARITRTLLSGDCIPQPGAGDINKPGTDGSVVRTGVYDQNGRLAVDFGRNQHQAEGTAQTQRDLCRV